MISALSASFFICNAAPKGRILGQARVGRRTSHQLAHRIEQIRNGEFPGVLETLGGHPLAARGRVEPPDLLNDELRVGTPLEAPLLDKLEQLLGQPGQLFVVGRLGHPQRQLVARLILLAVLEKQHRIRIAPQNGIGMALGQVKPPDLGVVQKVAPTVLQCRRLALGPTGTCQKTSDKQNHRDDSSVQHQDVS